MKNHRNLNLIISLLICGFGSQQHWLMVIVTQVEPTEHC
jgi:hypothetical protein